MTITLETLLKVSPMNESIRSQLLEKLNTLSDDQKFRLSTACWTALSLQFEARYKAKVAEAMLEIQEGKKTYTKEDFERMENELYTEFAKLLKSAESAEEITTVRQELEKYKKA